MPGETDIKVAERLEGHAVVSFALHMGCGHGLGFQITAFPYQLADAGQILILLLLREQHADYNIKILIPGHITDPSGMQKTILRYWDQYGMDEEKGDVAFIVLDLDCNSEKGRLIRKLEKENDNARFVVSNPCFEVWFLLHYRYSTRPYYTSADVIKDLRKYVPDYEKNTDIAVLIANDIEIAMKNAEKLRHHFLDMGAEWPSAACNPCTDVPIIIDVINGYRNGGGAL